MIIEKAFKRLLIVDPFYGLFCLGLPKSVTTDIDTLAVRRQGINVELLINPDFWETLNDDEQLAVLKHELSHIALQHMFMCESFSNNKLFNAAADLEVNSYINNLPKGALRAKDFGWEDKQGTKYYYEQFPNKEGEGDGDGEGSSYGNLPLPKGSKPIDNHDSWKDFKNLSSAEKQLIENSINTSLKNTAEQVEKMQGHIPGELSEIIQKLRATRPEVFNWKAYFRRLLGSIYDINLKMTRKRPSKRFEESSGVKHKKKVSMLVAVDTSGSVCSQELEDFFVEINYVYKAGAKVTVLQCDTQINSIKEYDGKTIPEIKGRGGTDFQPVIDYYLEHKRDFASLIFFTDGYCNIPENCPAGIVWVITPTGYHQDYPGKVIYIPKLNEQ